MSEQFNWPIEEKKEIIDCSQRCPYAVANPNAEGIDECSGEGLLLAEQFRDRPDYGINPLCLLVKREVTWDGETLHTPPDMDALSQQTRTANTQRWDELFEAAIKERGQHMADYIKRLDTDEAQQPHDPNGFQVSVAVELQRLLKPLCRVGLTLEEAAEHFQRMHGSQIATDVTNQILTDGSGHQSGPNTPG